MAFGGSTAKLFLSGSYCMMNCAVITCPAARTGRSAKTIEFAETPVRVSLPSASVAPAALIKARDGTGPVGVTSPMVFSSGMFGYGAD